MKLILASNKEFVFNYGYELTGIPRDKLRIGYVFTAALAATDEKFVAESKRKMQEAFPGIIEYDITGKSMAELRAFFSDKNVIQVEGGNAFYLLKAIRESGFDVLLAELLKKGVIYIGTSAGSYVMCPTIEVAGWKENRSRHGLSDFRALNYVPFLIKAHYTDNEHDRILEKSVGLKYPLRLLRNNQAFFVDNGVISFQGSGTEPKI